MLNFLSSEEYITTSYREDTSNLAFLRERNYIKEVKAIFNSEVKSDE